MYVKLKLKGPVFMTKGKEIDEVLPVSFDSLEVDSKICIKSETPNYKVDSIKIKDLTVYVYCSKHAPNKTLYNLIKDLPDDMEFIECGSCRIHTCKELKELYNMQSTEDYKLIKSKVRGIEKCCIKSISCNVVIYRENK